MCILLKLHYAKCDVSSLFCSKVIEEKPLRGRLDPPLPVFLPEGIYSPVPAVLYNVNEINGKTDKPLGTWPRPTQVNLSLFGPVALVYVSRQHQKSDSYDRYAWLEWKSGAYTWWS